MSDPDSVYTGAVSVLDIVNCVSAHSDAFPYTLITRTRIVYAPSSRKSGIWYDISVE